MAHIDLPTDSPGIRGLMEFRPETAAPLNHLAEVLLRPAVHDRLGLEGRSVQRVGRMILAGVAACAGPDGSWAPGVSAEGILWAMWDASGLAAPWRDSALGGGAAGARWGLQVR